MRFVLGFVSDALQLGMHRLQVLVLVLPLPLLLRARPAPGGRMLPAWQHCLVCVQGCRGGVKGRTDPPKVETMKGGQGLIIHYMLGAARVFFVRVT